MFKRVFIVVIVVLLIAVLIIGCSNNKEVEQVVETVEPKETVELLSAIEAVEPKETVEPEGTVEPEEIPDIIEETEDKIYEDLDGIRYINNEAGADIFESWLDDAESLATASYADEVTITGKGLPGTSAEGWVRLSITIYNSDTDSEELIVGYIKSDNLSTEKPVVYVPPVQTQSPAPSNQGQQGSGNQGSGGFGDERFNSGKTIPGPDGEELPLVPESYNDTSNWGEGIPGNPNIDPSGVIIG